MLSRNVGTKIEEAKNPDLPFLNLQDFLKNADITFGNLECPLSDSQIPLREGLVFRCLTRHFDGVINAGFDVLSTANNHSFDQGQDNIDFTIDYLKSHDILPVGTGHDLTEAHNGVVFPPLEGEGEGGVKFSFLSYSYTAFNDGGKSTHPQIATMNIEQVQKDVAELKNKSDVIIVNMHAGTEYTRHPNQQQIDFAHTAIDAGADVVIGHHPHWIQDIEVYSPLELFPPLEGEGKGGAKEPRKGLIFYSLGNFVFDQMWSQETREGLMVKLEFSGPELKSYELIPIIIDNYCCPRLANEAEKNKILDTLNLTKNN
ncbi:MAG: hypothetical protein A2751_01135 [Candidatus Doudnabacteria bacterium RIFCSPHIGHO2_01_FULL_46_14]|uniref:Capsule synthesis protein CapA domain-containing protein n=1 Tax=Candidatus Doudnabacteria bacterium RIFCSPHIGHO2_01_FULL_46_14 TaxID=1817824 RepID=A0A1F5NMX9_9BACT|nr:MAG: hypothetical protein A2751_01135 [Candidatus Doudnabacteria bacterium RIFCSPHIGHO2_01_FULL_46_14]